MVINTAIATTVFGLIQTSSEDTGAGIAAMATWTFGIGLTTTATNGIRSSGGERSVGSSRCTCSSRSVGGLDIGTAVFGTNCIWI